MKRSIFTLFLAVCLFTLCALLAFAEETPMPSFEERKEMAIETAIPYIQSFATEQGTEYNPEALTVEAYPSRGLLSFTSEYHLNVKEIKELSNQIMLFFYSDNQPLTAATAKYRTETNSTDIIMYGGSPDYVQAVADQVEIFNQIKTEDSPICIVTRFSRNYLYGNTVYGDNMIMEVDPYPDNLTAPYFESMDTNGYPLVYAEDFEYLVESMLKSNKVGGLSMDKLPPYNHAMIVRNRWIFGTAGVLLLVGFIGYRIYHSNRRRKRK